MGQYVVVIRRGLLGTRGLFAAVDRVPATVCSWSTAALRIFIMTVVGPPCVFSVGAGLDVGPRRLPDAEPRSEMTFLKCPNTSTIALWSSKRS